VDYPRALGLYGLSLGKRGRNRMFSQLYYSDKIGKDGKEYITCRGCSHLSKRVDFAYFGENYWYCSVQWARITAPAFVWFSVGLLDFWIKNNKPAKAMDLMCEFEKRVENSKKCVHT
jgi:hypothetical protein